MYRAYVTAFIEVLTTTPVETALAGLRAVLAARGHERLLAQILRATLRELEATRPRTVVIVGNVADKERCAAAIKVALTTLGANAEPEVIVDDTLIGGTIVEHNHVRIDESYKRALTTLYRSLTA